MDRRDDLSLVTASPRTFKLDGVEYPVAKLRPRDLGEIQEWIRGRFPDPRDRAREAIKDCPFEGLATRIWEKAEADAREWPPKFGSPEVEAEMTTSEGLAFMTWVFLRRTVPGLDLAKARELSDRLEVEDFKRLAALANPEGLDGPKA